MPFNHDSFAFRVDVIRKVGGDYQQIPRTGPESKAMALVRFLATQPNIAFALKDGESCVFKDPRSGRDFRITYWEINL